jgi:hypothetical protein
MFEKVVFSLVILQAVATGALATDIVWGATRGDAMLEGSAVRIADAAPIGSTPETSECNRAIWPQIPQFCLERVERRIEVGQGWTYRSISR